MSYAKIFKRIFTRIFSKIGRKIRIFSLCRKTTDIIMKKNRVTIVLWKTILVIKMKMNAS